MMPKVETESQVSVNLDGRGFFLAIGIRLEPDLILTPDEANM